MPIPRVTVLMPIYNVEKYLPEAIESILNQTYTDFELLIIDDASTDASMKVAKSICDPRIRLVQNESNFGVAFSRNKGFSLALGEYIVFMDGDDWSLPQRIEKQVKFMDANPEIGICGTWAEEMTPAGKIIPGRQRRYPTDSAAIKDGLLSDFTLLNPTLIIRRSEITTHTLSHDPAFRAAEDYDFFTKAAKVMALANLPEVLFYYRQHTTQTSRQHLRLMQNIAQVQLSRIQELFPQLNAYEIALHRMMISQNGVYTPEEVQQTERYLEKLETLNRQCGFYSEAAFQKFVRDLWLLYFFRIPAFHWQLGVAMQTSHFFHTLPATNQLKFFIKCLISWRYKRVNNAGNWIEEKA